MADKLSFLDKNGIRYLWSQLSLEDYPNNEVLVAIINAIDEAKADKTEVPEIIKKYFLVVETVRNGANYLFDGVTFSELYDKFQLGNVNMVCHVDGTDYIPLLSVTPSKIIFSGIYNTTSVSLDFDSDGVGTLSTTYICDRSSLTTHTSNKDIHVTAENKETWNAVTEKQNKNVIVYKDSTTKKASMTASEIMAKVRAGDNVYYTANLSAGTLHPYLEGSDTTVFFYSNYIDNSRVIGTGILIDAEGTITTQSYQLGHLTDKTVHITAEERELWNGANAYTDTAIANLVNSAPETLDTIGELAAAFEDNKEVVDVLNEAITTKYSATNPPPYPVTSVDGKTGDITLNSEVWTFTLSDGSVITKEVVVK